ncbi:MAG: hypothetical protein P8077_04375, partial [Gammaproteobacteria bacterium]
LPAHTATRSVKRIRLNAFLTHLAISIMIACGLLYMLTQHWYPSFYFEIDGGWDGLQLILGCDIILGPCLTLILFKPGKKGLWFDMTMVGIVQTVALSVGTWIVYQERPLAIAFTDHAFFMVGNATYQFVGQPVPDLDAFPGPYPKAIFIDLPDDPHERKILRLQQGRDGPLHADATRYRPMAQHTDTVLAWGAQRIEDVLAQNPAGETEINAWLTRKGRTRENTRLIPITARSAWRYIYVDAMTAERLGVTSSALTPPF